MEFLLVSELHIWSEKSGRGTKGHCEVHITLFVGNRPWEGAHKAGDAASPSFEGLLCSLQPGEKRLHLEERHRGMEPLFIVSTLTRLQVAAIPTVLTTDLKPMKHLELFPPILGVLAGTRNWVHYSAMPRYCFTISQSTHCHGSQSFWLLTFRGQL